MTTRTAEPPDCVIVATVLAIVALPVLRPAAPGNTAPVDLFVVIAVLMTGFWLARTRSRVGFPFVAAVTVAVLAGGTAPLLAPVPVSVSSSLLPLVQELWLLAWAATVFNVARTTQALQTLLHAWCAGAVGWVVVLFVGLGTGNHALTGITDRTGLRVALTMGDANYAADYFLVSWLLLVACGWPRNRPARWTCSAALAVAVFLTGSNGGILSLVLGYALLGLAATHRQWGAGPSLALAAGLLLVGLTSTMACGGLQQELVHDRLCVVHPSTLIERANTSSIEQVADSIGRADQSVGQRNALLTQTLRLSKTIPVSGLGPNSTRPALAREQVPLVKEAHNDYVAALVERGALGAAAIGILVLSVGLRVMPVIGARAGLGSVLPRPEALVLALVVMAIAGWFYEVLHTRHLWALLALVAAAGRHAATARRTLIGPPLDDWSTR